MKIYRYYSPAEKEDIIEKEAKDGYVLAEVFNSIDGDYLGFMKDGTIPIQPTPVEQRLEQIELTTAYTQLQVDYLAFLEELKGGE